MDVTALILVELELNGRAEKAQLVMCLGIALSYDLVADLRKEGKVECSDHGGNADVEEAMTLGLAPAEGED